VDVLRAQHQHLDLSAKQSQHLDLLLSENTFTVTTGHQLNLFSGGFVGMNNSGRGHVISYDGIHINYWRTPLEEGGEVKVDNRFAYELLSSYSYEPFF
jgi:hypothetical protein